MEPITTALIGFGFSARTFHLPFLQCLPEYLLTAVSTRQEERVRQLDAGIVHYASADQLLRETDAQLIIITSPNDSHFTLARSALELGKDVVIDKPFVCSVEEGEQLIELAQKQNRMLSVFHNRRWDGDFLTLKGLLSSGRLGSVHRFESHFDRFRPQVRQRWREQSGRGTGIWFDLGPHLVDQALQLFGSPAAITARLCVLRDQGEVTDYFNVQLHYPGLEAILHSSPFCASPNLRFQLHGALGSYIKQGLDPQEARLIAGATPAPDNWAEETRENWGELYTEAGRDAVPTVCGGYQHYYRQLAAALRDDAPNPVPADQALEVMRLLELAELSSREGRTLTL